MNGSTPHDANGNGNSHTDTEDLEDLIGSTPPLDPKQRAHLRHFYNIASAHDGVWDTMGCMDPGNEWLDALRYQLAEITYASALTHFHRLPMARGYFKNLFKNLIRKMLRREVWIYWKDTSKSGIRVNPDIKQLREGWTDPIRAENIMYSGHLLAMVSLYAMLFNDDHYDDDPASLTFLFDPIFYGMGPEKWEYNTSKLQQVIVDQMEKSGWLGCCCEPNMTFIVCNQFPLVAMGLNDLRHGTNLGKQVQEKYSAAWAKKGWLAPQTGYFIDWWRVEQDRLESRGSVGWSAWAHTFLNAWNPSVSKQLWPKQIAGWLNFDKGTGTCSINSPNVAALRRAQLAQGVPEEDIHVPDEPQLNAQIPWSTPIFGYISAALSELGPLDKLSSLLNYADSYLNPTFLNGGLYYPLNPQSYNNSDLKHTFMDPLSGNAMIAYARLNIPDGMRLLYENAWKREDERWGWPYLEEVRPGKMVDITRAEFKQGKLVVGVACWDSNKFGEEGVDCSVVIGNVKEGQGWRVCGRDGKEVGGEEMEQSVDESGNLVLKFRVTTEEKVFVLQK